MRRNDEKHLQKALGEPQKRIRGDVESALPR